MYVCLRIAFVVTKTVEYEGVTSSVYIAGVHMIFGPKKVIKFGKHALMKLDQPVEQRMGTILTIRDRWQRLVT